MLERLTLPRLISNGMVLQRDTNIRIWGQAPARETVTITFLGKKHTTFSDVNNNWEIHLDALPAGGPHTMCISTQCSGEIILSDILIGDVYLCSGQSNMEHTLGTLAPHFDEEIKQAENAELRQFKIPIAYQFGNEATDFTEGEWKMLSPETASDFSAVAYFYAKTLYEKYQIPIGIIKASQGGSPCEAWLSERALKDFPDLTKELEKWKDETYLKAQEQNTNAAIEHWYETIYKDDKGLHDKTPWFSEHIDTADWKEFLLPGYLTDKELPDFCGVVWLRKTITVPASMAGKPACLRLGTIIDADTAYVNGVQVGETGYLYPRRRYPVPAGVLKEGENSITIRVISNERFCGFISGKEYSISDGETKIDLTGVWNYKVGLSLDYDRPKELFLTWKPSALFNAMLAPVLPFTIRGILWYQAEANANNDEEVSQYKELFPALIKSWRKRFGLGDIPFLFVQLPNWGMYGPESDKPEHSSWAYMREVQTQTLALSHTGMATTYDVGEWNDLHPLDKETVGKRLARLAMKIIYKEKITASGPIIKKIEKEGNEFILSFHHVGAGLSTLDGKEPGHLYFQDDEGNFHKAGAVIHSDTLILTCPDKVTPKAIYYGWAYSPVGANLCNAEHIPAIPFRKKL